MLKKLLCKDNFDPYITRRLNCNNAGAHVVHLKKKKGLYTANRFPVAQIAL